MRHDMKLILPRVNAYRFIAGQWRPESRDWTIQAPLEKLREKYSIGSTAIFDHYVFHYPHQILDRLTSVDLTAADALMGANISQQNARKEALEDSGTQRRLEAVLKRIPMDTTILDPHYDGAVAEAVGTIVQDGIGLAIASKLLTIKRPYLIPMMDSRVQQCFGEREAQPLMAEIRRVMQAGNNLVRWAWRPAERKEDVDTSKPATGRRKPTGT